MTESCNNSLVDQWKYSRPQTETMYTAFGYRWTIPRWDFPNIVLQPIQFGENDFGQKNAPWPFQRCVAVRLSPLKYRLAVVPLKSKYHVRQECAGLVSKKQSGGMKNMRSSLKNANSPRHLNRTGELKLDSCGMDMIPRWEICIKFDAWKYFFGKWNNFESRVFAFTQIDEALNKRLGNREVRSWTESTVKAFDKFTCV